MIPVHVQLASVAQPAHQSKVAAILAGLDGRLDLGQLVLLGTLGLILVAFVQLAIAKFFWRARPMQAVQVAAISVLGLVAAATPYTYFLLPIIFVGAHIWVARRGRRP